MKKRSIMWRLFPPFFSLTAISLIVALWITLSGVEKHSLKLQLSRLETEATLLKGHDLFKNIRASQKTQDQLLTLEKITSTRITVVGLSGVVLGDSREDPSRMENHSNRPEVISAMKSGYGRASRFSDTLGKEMLYYAVSLKENGKVYLVIRVARGLDEISEELWEITSQITLGVLMLFLLSALVSWIMATSFARSLKRLRSAAENIASGDFESVEEREESVSEFAELRESLKVISLQLGERIRIITRQNNEQDTVFSGMIEGVMALDSKGAILRVNAKAGSLLRFDLVECKYRLFSEVVRHSGMFKLIRQVRSKNEVSELELELNTPAQYLHVTASPLALPGEDQSGIILIIRDVTESRRLENMRRDFVANVSHELKTPLTAIHGSIETLIDGAVDDLEVRDRFLEMIFKHSNRLSAIMEDLLLLSRIETQKVDREYFETTSVLSLVNSARDTCKYLSEERGMRVTLSIPDDLKINCHGSLLEQAFCNLLSNAIKYGDQSSEVKVSAEVAAGEMRISIEDHGPGIAQEHLPHLFQRFYRVDKGRSRDMGGTGLGLAIVKHIAQLHGGSCAIASVVGEGSVVTMSLPVS